MIENELDLVVKQIKYILTGKPITNDIKCKSSEYTELQGALDYLSNAMNDANSFIENLVNFDFTEQAPVNFSAITNNLKELDSVLQNLSFRANQLVDGNLTKLDNNETFLESFNMVVDKIVERESILKEQSNIIDESVNLLKAVIDNVSDCVIVTDINKQDILYLNNQAKKIFYSDGEDNFSCGNACDNKSCNLFEKIKTHIPDKSHSTEFEYTCKASKKHYKIHTYVVKWNDTLAYTHYISDITKDKQILEVMEELAYFDELTKIHNRHYCTILVNECLDEKENFIFAIIDLDGLKFANDNFGHLAGDEYLKTVVSVLKEQFILAEVCRIGGDEFAIISKSDKLRSVNDKLIRANNSLVKTSNKYPMSFSFGAIEVKPELELTGEQILSKADEIMYAQKNNKAYKKEKSYFGFN